MASRFISPFSDVGSGIKPSSGAKLFFSPSGIDFATQQKDTYTDEAATTPNTNPVIADASGVFSDIYLLGSYKVVLKDKNDVQIWEADPVRENVNIENGIAIYEDVASLKLASLTAGQIVNTKGYYTAGDGGQAEYLIAASQAVDGYGDHTLANGNVALLQFSGAVNVKQFGAVGDGAADDTAAIQAAINAVSVGGKIIGIGTDTYYFGAIAGNTTKFTVTKNIIFDWQGAKLLCDGTNDGAYTSTTLFKFEDCRARFKNYTFEDSLFLQAGPSRGVMPVVINSIAASVSGHEIGPCHVVKGQSFLTCGSGTPATYRASDIKLVAPMTADDIYYGVNLAQNGDNVYGEYFAETYKRLLYVYDVSDLNVDIRGGSGAQAVSAGLLIETYGDLPTKNIKVRAVFDSLNGPVSVRDRSDQSGGSGIFRDINLDIYVDSYGSNITPASDDVVALGSFNGSSWDSTSTTTMDNIAINFKSPVTNADLPIQQKTASTNYGVIQILGHAASNLPDFHVKDGAQWKREIFSATLSTAITGATQANPVSIASSSHGFSTGDKVAIDDVGGMTEINDKVFTVTVTDANNFTLDGEDGTGHTAYTSGGTAHATVSLDLALVLPDDDLANWIFDTNFGVGFNTAFSGQKTLYEKKSVHGYMSSSVTVITGDNQISSSQTGGDTPTAHFATTIDDSFIYGYVKGYTTTTGNIVLTALRVR
jgi:hypothetical protein